MSTKQTPPGQITKRPYHYERPWFPGDPPEPIQPPRPLPELVEEVADNCRLAASSDDDELGSFSLSQAALCLIQDLECRASAGNRMAGAELFHLGRVVSSSLMRAYSERVPAVLDLARGSIDVPGFITRDRNEMEKSASLMDEIEQGSINPRPLVPEGKKRAWNPDHPKAQLVGSLFDYMVAIRRNLRIGPLDRYFTFPPRLLEISALPELTPSDESWKAWKDVSWRIILDWTENSPATHEIFNRPPLDELNGQDTKSGKHLLPGSHRSGWERLAKTSIVKH